MEKTFTEKESLQVIQQMIDNTNTALRAHGHYYILWGIMTALAALLHYYFIKNPANFQPGMVWPVIMIIAGIIHGVLVSKMTKERQITTFTDTTMKFLWIAFTISILCLVAVMFGIGPQNAYPMFLILYGMGTFASGGQSIGGSVLASVLPVNIPG